jgi:hypothetical protein
MRSLYEQQTARIALSLTLIYEQHQDSKFSKNLSFSLKNSTSEVEKLTNMQRFISPLNLLKAGEFEQQLVGKAFQNGKLRKQSSE